MNRLIITRGSVYLIAFNGLVFVESALRCRESATFVDVKRIAIAVATVAAIMTPVGHVWLMWRFDTPLLKPTYSE